MRYGFKAEAERWSNDLRTEMSVGHDKPLCPWKLSEHLSVPILRLSSLPKSADICYLMSSKGQSEFSATVCFEGIKSFIIINDTQDSLRLASNIAHEIAHILLRHPPQELFDKNGNRKFIKEYEDEANTLGPTLLVSEKCALEAYKIIKRGEHTLATLSKEWMISKEVIQMRMNLVGARKRCA